MPPAQQQRKPPDEALPEPTVGVSQAAGAGAAAAVVATASGAAAGLAATAPAVATIGAGTVVGAPTAVRGAEALMDLLDAFFRRQRAREDAWLVRNLRGVDGITQQDILEVVADENARRAEFERRVRERLKRDASVEVSRAERRKYIEGLLRREKRYAEQRTAAMAIRSLALADRLVLRRISPQGAFWKLGVADKHTPDCIAMAAGKLWPWVVLDSFHPPTHTGCVCTLHGYAQAVASGWMKAGDVMDTAVALRRAAAARLLLHEDQMMDMRAALVRAGITTAERFDRAALRAGGLG